MFAAYFYARTGKRLCGYACYVAHKERHAQKYADEADVLGGGGD